MSSPPYRHVAGKRRVDRSGEPGYFGEGQSEWGSIDVSEAARQERIGSRTLDGCASEYSPSGLSARQGRHTILFKFGGVRLYIALRFPRYQCDLELGKCGQSCYDQGDALAVSFSLLGLQREDVSEKGS